ncbi:prominin-2 [Pseudophryne corroboree]|uniref:prominin-2 n=1 Tax=Pseudophryne corroboree TaxID=495146 RepID=UPI003081BD24
MGSLDSSVGSLDLVMYWVLCVLLYNVGQVAPQTCPLATDPEKLTFNEVENNQNFSISRRDADGLAGIYKMQRLFLNAVQPNPFPQELLRVLLTNISSLELGPLVKYEAGYVTCAVITLLFFLFMLVFGLTFCIFQCRGRRILPCEGGLCKPTPVFLGLLYTICFVFAGLVCTFYLNQKTHNEVGTGVQDMKRTLQDFRLSVTSVPQAIGQVVSEFSVPKEKVFADLQSFSTVINQTVNAKLNDEIRPLLEAGLQTARDLETAAQIVVNVNQTLVNLQKGGNILMEALSNHRETLLEVLSDRSCDNCGDAANTVQRMQLGLNYSQVPSIGEYVNKLNSVRRVNIPGIFQRILKGFNSMPNLVSDQTKSSISDITTTLDSTEQQIKSYVNNTPINRYIDTFATAVLTIENMTTSYGQKVEHYEYYRWVLGVFLCCVLLLITICTALGLILGVVGLYLQDPVNSRWRRRNGFGFLLIGVYLTFILSWALIIFVLITFLIGGNVHTLLCKHWVNGDIYRFFDDPRNLPSMNLKMLLGLRNSSNISDMYDQCKRGKPIWDIIQISNPMDLESAFNISQYTAQLEAKIENFTVDVDGLNMISNIALRVLTDYNNSGLDQVPYTTILAQIQNPLLTVDLGQFATALESLSSIQSNATIRSQLQNESVALRDLQNTTVRDQEADVSKLNSSLQSLAVLAPTLKVRIVRTIQDVNTVKGPLLEGTIGLLKNESKCQLHQSLEYFTQYLDWVNQTIMQDIASCRSVPMTLDNFRVIICDNVDDPWNGFWFCLGWCSVLLIPNIFLSIKSAQYIAPKSRDPSPEEENLFPLTHSTDAERR